MTEEDIVRKLEENTATLEELKIVTLKTARYVKWLRIMDILKLLLIIVPLIAAYIYLPRLLQDIAGSYGELIPGGLNSLLK
ncbi:MAG: hypothetical protein NTY12_01015 [Candidatus Falkowbacteria bacterium]|nr:hypothetical protein [Candidatus Falkowbacteria bacterium]